LNLIIHLKEKLSQVPLFMAELLSWGESLDPPEEEVKDVLLD